MSIEGQGHFLTRPKILSIQNFKPDFLINYCAVLNQILYENFQVQGIEKNDAGHMTKMAATPIYGKNYDGLESPMLHIKFRENRPAGSGEKISKGFLP